MGGTIALSVRYSDGEEYRGSCWTNILPQGLFGPDFFIEEKSEAHAREWLKNILRERAKEPQLEEMWGGWNKLAPLSYGIIVVDYASSGILVCNNYTSINPDSVFSSRFYPGSIEKFIDLHRARLISRYRYTDSIMGERHGKNLTETEIAEYLALCEQDLRGEKVRLPMISYWIRLWQKDVAILEPENYAGAYSWVASRFILSEEEKSIWQECQAK